MGFILLEGLDRSGKSTVAEYYREQGYEIVHLSAPHKKYFTPGYSGPSYLEEIVEMYNIYASKDVVFDRTPYGELVWPEVFGRLPLLNDEDYEYLTQLEYNEDAVKYYMFDENVDAHWKRCVDNKEPVNRMEFVQAGRLYDNFVEERGFERKQLSDFSAMVRENEQTAKKSKTKGSVQKKKKGSSRDAGHADSAGSADTRTTFDRFHKGNELSMEQKLNKANAIRALLEGKIIKKKGVIYDDLEKDIRSFLQQGLEGLFIDSVSEIFTEDDTIVLKSMAQRIIDKME